MIFRIQMAKVYNHHTGASITHYDVEKWGFIETEVIINAFKLLAVA